MSIIYVSNFHKMYTIVVFLTRRDSIYKSKKKAKHLYHNISKVVYTFLCEGFLVSIILFSIILLFLIFNTIVIHGYIPQMVMDTIITPIIKDKKGDVMDSDNYRPLAITCIVSNILELLILNRYSSLLKTTCNKFGLRNC